MGSDLTASRRDFYYGGGLMDQFEKLCEEKHKFLAAELQRHSKWLGDHENKIDDLERSDASNTTQINNLTRSLSGLTKALWGLAASIMLMIVGTIIDKI